MYISGLSISFSLHNVELRVEITGKVPLENSACGDFAKRTILSVSGNY